VIFGVRAILGLVMDTKDNIPTPEELGLIREELSGVIAAQFEQMQKTDNPDSACERDFLFIEVSNGPEGSDEMFGNLFDIVLTPYPTLADDEWRLLLVDYLDRLRIGLIVKELQFGEYHGLAVIGFDSGFKEDDVFSLLYPFMAELKQAGKV
jgi:hypothetical protein